MFFLTRLAVGARFFGLTSPLSVRRSCATSDVLEPRRLFAGYTITDIGPGVANAVNDNGIVVGYVPGPNSTVAKQDAYWWSAATGLKDITWGGDYGDPQAINNAGEIVGYAGHEKVSPIGSYAFRFNLYNESKIGGSDFTFGDSTTSPASDFTAIDNSFIGLSVGHESSSAVTGLFYNGDTYDLTGIGASPAIPYGIADYDTTDNGNTAIVGYSGGDAYYSLGDTIVNLEPYVNSSGSGIGSAQAISPNGDYVAGESTSSYFNTSGLYPFLATINKSNPIYDSVQIISEIPQQNGVANSVNNSGVTVGQLYGNTPDAFVSYGTDGVEDLNQLIPLNSGWTLSDATGVNSSGQICGYGMYNGVQSAFLLTPSTGVPAVSASAIPTVTTAGMHTSSFGVAYNDPYGIQSFQFDADNLTATGPNGLKAAISLSNVSQDEDNTFNSVTYSIAGPGGSWSSADNGTYTVSLNANQIQDNIGNYAAAQTLFSFTVNIPIPVPQLTGTTIGTAGSYHNDGNTIAKATDGNLTTFYDGSAANGNWVGLDLGTNGGIVTQVEFASRSGFASRMNGGIFQASNSPAFGSGVVNLYTIASNANPGSAGLTTALISNTVAYRYYRYLSPAGSYGDVSEVQFFGTPGTAPIKLTGTAIGTAGSYANDGNTIAKATDGSLSTYFDGPTANGNWVGLDLGSAEIVTKISYAPRSGFASRMVGGKLQYSTTANFSSGVTTLLTITATPATGVLTTVTLASPVTARYFRYLSPNGSYGDISEFQLFT